MKKLFIAILLLTLTSCGVQPNLTGLSGIESGLRDYNKQNVIMLTLTIIKYDYTYPQWTLVWDYKYGYVRDEWVSSFNEPCSIGNYKVYRTSGIPKVYDTKQECLEAR
jgi:hypothetical protein